MTERTEYAITLYWSAADRAFLAEVPELAGCMADGATYEEALANAKLAIREWIATATELGRRSRRLAGVNANEAPLVEPMAQRPDKRRRKEMLDQWRANERASARAKLPLPDDLMKAMFDMLDAELPRHRCDHSLRLVERWLTGRGLNLEAVVEWLRENGGHCDCEALANAEQRWQDAIHDVNW